VAHIGNLADIKEKFDMERGGKKLTRENRRSWIYRFGGAVLGVCLVGERGTTGMYVSFFGGGGSGKAGLKKKRRNPIMKELSST